MCVRECKMLWHFLALFCYEKLHFVILSESGDIQIAQANLLFFRRRTFAKVCGKWLCKSSHFIDLLLLLQMFVGWLLIEYQHIKGYENGYWGGWGCFINHPLPPHNLPPGGGIYLFGAMKYHFARRVFYGTRNSIFWLNLLSMKNELLVRYSVPKSRYEKISFWISCFLWKNELLFKTHQNYISQMKKEVSDPTRLICNSLQSSWTLSTLSDSLHSVSYQY